MNRDRLKILKSLLSNLDLYPNRVFNINYWYMDRPQDNKILVDGLGMACLHPAFQSEGLGFNEKMEPVFQDKKFYQAAALFFDISVSNARKLFHPNYYDDWNSTPSETVVRINSLLKNGLVTNAFPRDWSFR